MFNLEKIGQSWKFRNEVALEDFFWRNLERLTSLTPLKRQMSVGGQFCDILAKSDDGRLVVIELKNQEDRYIVQQLTRYYHYLSEEKPLLETIDYSKKIRLIAITPSCHKDNKIDALYSKLDIEILTFKILDYKSGLFFRLLSNDEEKLATLKLPHSPIEHQRQTPQVPRKLADRLSALPRPHEERILKIRESILNFHEKMQEFNQATHILYGNSRSNICAELRYRKLENKEDLALFLRLPIPHRKHKGRMLICTPDWEKVEKFVYHPKAFFKGQHYWPWEYERYFGNATDFTSINDLVDMALRYWAEKLV